jgi:cytochrome c oxidase assembly factor CtaG
MSHPMVEANGAVQPLLDAWSVDPWVAGALALAAGLYVRGWRPLHARLPHRFGTGRLAAFLGGLAAIAVALGSPLHALGAQLLQAHMVQHLLLMMVAPPLLWLGAPLLPLLRGLPRHMLRARVGRFFARRPLADLGRWLVYPSVAWVVYVGSTWAWHTTPLYQRALASELWHEVQHACFLGAALAFWWSVLRPWPGRPLVPRGAIMLYIILADLQNTVLCAWLVFAERLIYPAYAKVSPLWGVAALDDQAAAGAIMWVSGSIAFLLPIVWIVSQMLSPQGEPTVILNHQQVPVSHLRRHGRGDGAP